MYTPEIRSRLRASSTASWIEEEATIPESDDTFGQVTLGAHKVGCMIRISEELLHDSAFDLAAYIAGEFARRVGAAEEEAIGYVADSEATTIAALKDDFNALLAALRSCGLMVTGK